MANPFDQFDEAPVAAAAGNPFDQFDEKTNPFNQFDEPSLGDKSLGLLEAGASMVAPLPGMIAGGLVGLGSLLSGKGAEEAQRLNQYVQDKNFGMGAYKPATKTGQEYAEALGEVVNKPREWAGAGGEFVGGSAGRMTGEIAADTLMNFLPLGVGVKGMKGAAGKISELKSRVGESPRTSVDALDAFLDKKEAQALVDQVQPGEQVPLDIPRVEVRGTADSIKPGEAGAGPMLPEAVPEVSRRQTAFDFGEGLPEQINVDRVGEAVRSDQNPNDLYAREQLSNQVSAELDAAAREQRLAEQPPRVTDDLQGQADLFEQGNPTPYTLGEGQWHVDENGMPIRSDLSMEANNLEAPLQRNLFGDELGPALEQQRSLTEAIDTIPTSPFKGDIRDVALELLGAPTGARSFNERTRGQGGGLYLGEQIRKAKDEAPVRWYTASPEGGRQKTYTLAEQATRPNAEGQRYGPGQYISQSRDFSSVYGGPEGRMYTVDRPFDKPFDINSGKNEQIYQSLVERTGSRAEANKLLAKSGYDAITFTSPPGS